MEKETGRRPAWKVDMHVGRWRVFGHQSNHGRSHRGEPERRVVHKNGPAEESKRKMGTKQLGDGRGGRRGARTKTMQIWTENVSLARGLEDGLEGKAGDGRTCSGTEERVHNT